MDQDLWDTVLTLIERDLDIGNKLIQGLKGKIDLKLNLTIDLDKEDSESEHKVDDLELYYDFTKNSWANLLHESSMIVELLSEKSFFKRFTPTQLKSFLPKIKLKTFNENDIVFIKNSVFVILSGDIIIKSHKMRICPAKVIANYKEGDILGSDHDNRFSQKQENWCVVRERCLLAEFTHNDFTYIWNMQMNKDLKLFIPTLKNNKLFKDLSMQSIYMMFELMEK